MKNTISFIYSVFNAGGNKTALVEDADFNNNQKFEINAYILATCGDVEQVGFINRQTLSLQMAGDEFCVNATRCAMKSFFQDKVCTEYLNVSGAEKGIFSGILPDGRTFATVEIGKLRSEIIEKTDNHTKIKLDGIEFIFPENKDKLLKELHKNSVGFMNDMRNFFHNQSSTEKATGIILISNENKKSAEVSIEPIVWVRKTDTIYHETACGSGSLATAIFLGKEKLEVYQPSGYSLLVELKENNGFLLSGTVTGISFCEIEKREGVIFT